jgi:hypothetical protein
MQEKLNAESRRMSFLHPTHIYVSARSTKRRIAALRIVEAVRHHLAANDGRLPKSLDQIEDLPIPIDPLTDQPFLWNVDGKTATLRGKPLPSGVAQPGSNTARAGVLEYRLRLE